MSQLRHNKITRYLLLVLGLLSLLAWAQRLDAVALVDCRQRPNRGRRPSSPSPPFPTSAPPPTVDIAIEDVVDLYGYQFELFTDDPAVVAASATIAHDFFDTNSSGLSLPGWDATCAAGTCRFARTEFSPDGPVSGSGVLARVTLTAVTPVTAPSTTVYITTTCC